MEKCGCGDVWVWRCVGVEMCGCGDVWVWRCVGVEKCGCGCGAGVVGMEVQAGRSVCVHQDVCEDECENVCEDGCGWVRQGEMRGEVHRCVWGEVCWKGVYVNVCVYQM